MTPGIVSGDIFVIQRIKKKRKKPTKILYFEFGYGMVKLRAINRKLTEWPGRDVFSDGGTYLTGGNNPYGAKEEDRDASGRWK